MGGSLGKGKSGSSNTFSNDVWSGQQGALTGLYNRALNQFDTGNNYQSQIEDQAGNLSNLYNQLVSSNSGTNSQLASGGVYGDTSDIRQKLLDSMGQRSNVGTMYESIVGGSGNTYVDPLIQKMQQDAARNVSTLQNSNAASAADLGQSGSSRQAMQNAMFANQANQDLATQEAQMRQQAYDIDLQNKMGIAQQADTNRQAEQDRLMQMLQGAQSSKQSAIDNSQALGSLFSNAMNPWLQAQQAQWNPINNLANVIGNAIMTSSGRGSSKSKGFGGSGGLFG